MEPNQPSFSYADASGLVIACLAAFLPPERITTADYAAANRYLANEGGGYVGLWTHEKAPYLIGPMDALDSPDYTTVVLPKPGQCGGTAIGENWLLKCIATDPADMLWFMQTEAAIQAYVKQTINPLIETHPAIRARLGTERWQDSLGFKGFEGMSVQFLAATRNNLINKRAGRILADEWDAIDLGGTDPKTMIDVRRQTFGEESKLFALSHPDLARGIDPENWTSGIMALYADSTRHIWWWRCPHCDMWSSPNPGARFHMAFCYDQDASLDQVAESAHLLCPHNGCIVADHDRRTMNTTGVWVGRGQTIDEETGEIGGELAPTKTAGFWIVGVMSPFVFGGLGGLARALVKAQREDEANGVDKSAREVTVKQLGLPYQPPRMAGSLDAATLAERADDQLQLGQVPAGVRFITAAIDVQGNRFEILFRGWGVNRESWIIDRRIMRTLGDAPIDPATGTAEWDAVLAQTMDAEFALDDGTGRIMRVRAVGVDSAGAPGVTEQAYAAWRRQRAARRARFMGDVSGRKTYNLLLLKGGSTPNIKNLTVVMPDTQRTDRMASARGEIPLGIFNPNTFKDALAAQLQRATPGAGYVHVPAALRDPQPPHAFFEQLVAEQKQPNGSWKKIAIRNEALDLMVMSAVIAHLHAPTRFDWTRPPPWARDWDQNSLVVLPAAVQHPEKLAAPAIQAAAMPSALPQPPPAGRLSLRQLIAQQAAGRKNAATSAAP